MAGDASGAGPVGEAPPSLLGPAEERGISDALAVPGQGGQAGENEGVSDSMRVGTTVQATTSDAPTRITCQAKDCPRTANSEPIVQQIAVPPEERAAASIISMRLEGLRVKASFGSKSQNACQRSG